MCPNTKGNTVKKTIKHLQNQISHYQCLRILDLKVFSPLTGAFLVSDAQLHISHVHE